MVNVACDSKRTASDTWEVTWNAGGETKLSDQAGETTMAFSM